MLLAYNTLAYTQGQLLIVSFLSYVNMTRTPIKQIATIRINFKWNGVRLLWIFSIRNECVLWGEHPLIKIRVNLDCIASSDPHLHLQFFHSFCVSSSSWQPRLQNMILPYHYNPFNLIHIKLVNLILYLHISNFMHETFQTFIIAAISRQCQYLYQLLY